MQGDKSVSLEVLHLLLKFGEHRLINKKVFFSRDPIGSFNHSYVLLLAIELEMVEMRFSMFKRYLYISVSKKWYMATEKMVLIHFFV